jgi:hypothetical protein
MLTTPVPAGSDMAPHANHLHLLFAPTGTPPLSLTTCPAKEAEICLTQIETSGASLIHERHLRIDAGTTRQRGS